VTWPTVETAKRIAKRHGLQQVIVFGLHKGEYAYASYGATRALCDDAKRVADSFVDSLAATGSEEG
jgi:hypothetical protein